MNGSYLRKTSRLIWYLSKHPGYIDRYLKTSVRSNVRPIDLGLPWITYSAIDFLETFVKPYNEGNNSAISERQLISDQKFLCDCEKTKGCSEIKNHF